MNPSGPRCRPAPFRAALIALALLPTPALAQASDCGAQRAALDAAAATSDAGPDDAALQRQRDEIARVQAYADGIGCGDGVFDDPSSAPCQALGRRVEMLRIGLQRMQVEASRGDPAADDRRRALQARFDAECSGAGAGAGDAPVTVLPVDPDAPPGPAAAPTLKRVICVRRCDGAHYPLAVDVASDRMADMDRICQAQCPAADSSAFASQDGDVADATATDGTSYASLPSAYAYLRGPSRACACRAPRQSWAEALAGAEALIPPHKGDVTVTAAISAAMARPVAPASPAPAAARAKAPRSGKPRATMPLLTIPAPAPGRDLTPDFRGSDPTL